MTQAIGIGVIGCGERVRGLALAVIRTCKQAHVTALYDPSEDAIRRARQDLAPDAKVHADVGALCADPSVDWVMIGSPNALHAEHAVAAMNAGKHVFCEKPMATTIDGCLAMAEAQRRNGCQFSLGFVLRYSAHCQQLRQLLEAGCIGQVISMEFNETLDFNHGGFIHQDWRRHTRLAGTHLLEKCCHDIDVVNHLLGARAARVASFGGNNFFIPENRRHVDRVGPSPDGRPPFGGVEWADGRTLGDPFTRDKDIVDNQVVLIEFDNDTRATFHTNCCAGIQERRMYLVGSEGAIRADMLAGTIELRRIGWNQPTVVYSNPGGDHAGGDMPMIHELIATMAHGTPPRAGIAEGIISTVTCFAIDEAMTSGQVVDVRPWWTAVEESLQTVVQH